MLKIQYSLLYPSLDSSDTLWLTTIAPALQVLAPHEWHHMKQEQCLKMTNSQQYCQTHAELHTVLFEVPHATSQVLHAPPLGEGGFRSYGNWTLWQLTQDMHLAQTLPAPRESNMEPPLTAKHDLVESTLNHWIKLIHKGGRSTLYIAMDFHIPTLRPSKVVYSFK
jgi:hypothetical protein